MRRTFLTQRVGPSFYVDLRQGFRMGDFACLHIWLLEWRQQHPSAHLTILWNGFHWRSVYARMLPQAWLFEGLADELWEAESSLDTPPTPPNATSLGDLYTKIHIWDLWHRFARTKPVTPTIQPPASYQQRAHACLKSLQAPPEFVVLQPLYDAGYNKQRNAKPLWWKQLGQALACKMPVVVVGSARFMAPLGLASPHIYPFWQLGQEDPLLSLAVAKQAKAFIGGETGLTLWAGVCGISVVALYRQWKSGGHFDYRPIGWQAPVVHAPLEGDVPQVVQTIQAVASGQQKESTPL